MSYAAELNTWLAEMHHDFGEYMPSGFPVQFFSMASKYDTSERGAEEKNELYSTLYSMARSLHSYIKAARNGHDHRESRQAIDPADEKFYLVPNVDPDGSIYYIDRFTNRVIMSMVRQPNGLFSYYGSRKMMNVAGGRGELGDLLRRVEDGEFFYDRKRAA